MKPKPHKCVPKPAGSIRRVTGYDGRILKRPVIVQRFWVCEICEKVTEEAR